MSNDKAFCLDFFDIINKIYQLFIYFVYIKNGLVSLAVAEDEQNWSAVRFISHMGPPVTSAVSKARSQPVKQSQKAIWLGSWWFPEAACEQQHPRFNTLLLPVAAGAAAGPAAATDARSPARAAAAALGKQT